MFVNFQISASIDKTVESKHAFKDFALSHGVTVRKYCTNNGAFTSRVFKESMEQ